ncbi:hypothetical protein ACFLSJ_01245 [Verrucomicrobiota bacterium]
MTSPIHWIPPDTFSPTEPGLGLPRLEGAEHEIIYDPLPCRGNVDEGGDGRYESLMHGTYVHSPSLVLHEDRIIACWLQHSRDEAGSGLRILARVGAFDDAGDNIAWGGEETLCELVPQCMPLRRRESDYDPDEIHGGTVLGSLRAINGRLYVIGYVYAIHGATDDVFLKRQPPFAQEPIPAEHFSDHRDKGGFRHGLYYELGIDFFQRRRIGEATLEQDTPMYTVGKARDRVEVTPGRFKAVEPLLDPYVSAAAVEEAPPDFRRDVFQSPHIGFDRRPVFAPGTERLAADGVHGLAHYTQFRRPDGKWVVVRDNIKNPGKYYAVVKDRQGQATPPAAPTNLHGEAMPAAGELPDGRVWIVCNARGRREMYLTLSSDGIAFDRSWSVLTIDRQCDGGLGKGGGPQYFKTVTVGTNIWVIYSITKEQIGLSRIPVGCLAARRNTRPK